MIGHRQSTMAGIDGGKALLRFQLKDMTPHWTPSAQLESKFLHKLTVCLKSKVAIFRNIAIRSTDLRKNSCRNTSTELL
jgi:hypothetical protein